MFLKFNWDRIIIGIGINPFSEINHKKEKIEKTEKRDKTRQDKKMFNFEELLPPLPPNTCRVIFSQFSKKISKDRPDAIKEFMEEDEYVKYIKRIEHPFMLNFLSMFMPIIPLLLFAIFLVVTLATGLIYLVFLPIMAFILFGVCVFLVFFGFKTASDKAISNAESVLNEINSKYYSRGIKWTYNSVRVGVDTYVLYLEIVTFTPGAAGAPPMEGVIFNSSNIGGYPERGPSGPAPEVFKDGSVKPPADSEYGADPYSSKEAYMASSSSQQGGDGPNSYPPKEASAGTYPGDPANPCGY